MTSIHRFRLVLSLALCTILSGHSGAADRKPTSLFI